MNKYFTGIILATLVIGIVGYIAGCEKTYRSEDKLTAGIFLEPEERATLPQGIEVRKAYDKAVDLTKESEGFESEAYNDAARYCTIGYGHLIQLAPCDGSIPEDFQEEITEPRGTDILRKDMEKAEIGVMTLVDIELTDGQYGALCDFAFNVGVGNFRDSTLLKRVNAGDHDRVPFEFRRWIFAGGKKLQGLQTRREKEVALYFDEIGIPRATPPTDQDLTPIDIRIGETGS